MGVVACAVKNRSVKTVSEGKLLVLTVDHSMGTIASVPLDDFAVVVKAVDVHVKMNDRPATSGGVTGDLVSDFVGAKVAV